LGPPSPHLASSHSPSHAKSSEGFWGSPDLASRLRIQFSHWPVPDCCTAPHASTRPDLRPVSRPQCRDVYAEH
ncbi:hypothetical protein RB213_011655, partial [Colletotrichum asianum]